MRILRPRGYLLKGLTPIPYKIFTITSGFAGFNFGLFIVLSAITRGARFYLVAFLLTVTATGRGTFWRSGWGSGPPFF